MKKVRFYKWYRQPVSGTMLEVTKDYFADDDNYINEENGWVRIDEEYVELEIDDE